MGLPTRINTKADKLSKIDDCAAELVGDGPELSSNIRSRKMAES